MMEEPLSREAIEALNRALRTRLEVIADHALRDRDSSAHLKALQEASETLSEMEKALQGKLPPRLKHFLERRSYEKALAFTGEMLGEHVDH